MRVFTNAILVIFVMSIGRIDTVINNNRLNIVKSLKSGYTINKVTLTQKGYIQFLKYMTKVPPLKDYTFCIWVKSNNLTYNHPLLSYSKHEKNRLIRMWIGPGGVSLNLEILNIKIFQIPIKFQENHWYHICQSWSSNYGLWEVYTNSKLQYSGIKPQLKGVKIDGGGDIVVGQEYTDFDKGLDDGIEGDIFGFNFVLSSTIKRNHRSPLQDLNYFSNNLARNPTNHLELSSFDYVGDFNEKPLGLKLVELSYNNCVRGRGAPISDRRVLISWTRTPVRVFGGAVLQNVPPFCVHLQYNKPLNI